MSQILFTHSYFLKFDPKQWRTMQPYAPLGTLYAASILREKGHKVALFDTMFLDSAELIEGKLSSERTDVLVIYDDCFNYLTKMCLTNMREAAFTMIRLAKQHGCKVIVSSSDAADHYKTYLEKGADFIVIGEGEITLRDLIDVVHSEVQNDFLKIPGLAFFNGEKLVTTGKRNVLQELDQIPFPAWDLVNVEEYKSRWMEKHGYFSMNMVTTRGCPYKCNWCAKPIYGNRYNSHSAERIVTELETFHDKYQPDHIWFCDDIFALKPGWVKEFADLIQKKNIEIKFKIQSRVDLLVNEETVKDLARAGCETIWLGAESGSQKILDAMDKGIKVNEIEIARKLLGKHKINTAFFLQFGYMGETREDIFATIGMVKQLLPDEIGISVSYPLPGTKFYENVKSNLKQKQNWTDSDDLAMMFRDDQPKDYYKILQRYVHKEFQKQRGFRNINLLKNPIYLSHKQWRSIFALAYYVPASLWYKKQFESYGV